MKTLIIVGIVLGVGIILITSLGMLSDIRTQECKAWGGVMTGLFGCVTSNADYGIPVSSQNVGYGKHVFVNFTNNDQGHPVVENANIVLYTGGFNSTVDFRNDLEHDITLEIMDTSPQFESPQSNLPGVITIPSGTVWSNYFKNFRQSDVLVYQFITTPDNLSGIITVKGYPSCMTQNEVKSLYSQVGVYPKFPSYLPEGYSFECGVHNFNSAVYLGFWTNELREKFDDKVNAVNNQEFLADGGVSIYYQDDFVLNGWIENPDYDKYEKAKGLAEHPWATTLNIGDDPAVMMKEYFWKGGEQKLFNELTVFSDNEIWYSVRTGLPESEVINIAESLFSEPESDEPFEHTPSKLGINWMITEDHCREWCDQNESYEHGCNEPIFLHLEKYSNLLDEEFVGVYSIEDIGLPDGVSQEKFEECVDFIYEKRTSIELENEN